MEQRKSVKGELWISDSKEESRSTNPRTPRSVDRKAKSHGCKDRGSKICSPPSFTKVSRDSVSRRLEDTSVTYHNCAILSSSLHYLWYGGEVSKIGANNRSD